MATGKRPPTVFEWLWWTLTPVLVVVIMVFSIIGYSKITYGDYEVSLKSLRVFRPFYFWNKCRKEMDPTYNDSMMKSNFQIDSKFVLSRIRLFPTLISKITWICTTLKALEIEWKAFHNANGRCLGFTYWSGSTSFYQSHRTVRKMVIFGLNSTKKFSSLKRILW